MLSAAATYRALFATVISAGTLYVVFHIAFLGPQQSNVVVATLLCAFLILLGGVSIWVMWNRPLSVLWKFPLLFLSVGAGVGLVVWLLFRRTDHRLALGALLMQTAGAALVILMMIGGHAP